MTTNDAMPATGPMRHTDGLAPDTGHPRTGRGREGLSVRPRQWGKNSELILDGDA